MVESGGILIMSLSNTEDNIWKNLKNRQEMKLGKQREKGFKSNMQELKMILRLYR